MNDKITLIVDREKRELTLYSSISDLPIKRYQLLQKYSLIDAGVGSDYNDVVRHLTRFDSFIQAQDWESIAIERENLLINFNFMLQENFTKGYVLACMVKKIDGEVIDITDDNIDEIVGMLSRSDLSVGAVEEITKFKKKVLTINSL